MAAIMNPFMIPLWDSGGRIGFEDGRARHKRAGPSIPIPKHRRSRRLAALRPHHRAAEQARRISLVNPRTASWLKATKHLIKGSWWSDEGFMMLQTDLVRPGPHRSAATG